MLLQAEFASYCELVTAQECLAVMARHVELEEAVAFLAKARPSSSLSSSSFNEELSSNTMRAPAADHRCLVRRSSACDIRTGCGGDDDDDDDDDYDDSLTELYLH